MKQNQSQDALTLTNIKFPIFKINFQDIKDLPGGLPTDRPKLLLKIMFTNLEKPGGIKIIPYFTKTHGNYAEKEAPLEHIVHPETGTSDYVPSNLIIGNNDITIKKLLKKKNGRDKWDFFRFKPVFNTPNGETNPHLSFYITAVDTDDAMLIEDEVGYSNPCPPGKPSDEG